MADSSSSHRQSKAHLIILGYCAACVTAAMMLLIAMNAYHHHYRVLSYAALDIITIMQLVIFALLVAGGLLDGLSERIHRSIGFRCCAVAMFFLFFWSVCTPLVR